MKRNLLLMLALFISCIINVQAENTCTGFKTFTQGGWGAQCNGGNPGCYRDANFTAAFPEGLTIGCNNTLTLTTAAAVQAFLPSGSTPRALDAGALVNPGASYQNVLAGQLVALTLSVGFDAYDPNFASSSSGLGDLVINSGTFSGYTVSQFLVLANRIIGGCDSSYSFSDINATADMINNNYDNGTQDNGNLVCYRFNFSVQVQSNVKCNGGTDGSISITVTGGTAPYTYTLSNGAVITSNNTTETFTGLPAGTYTASVTDANGHTASGTGNITITQPDPITLSFSSTNVSCNGGNNGTASVTPHNYEAPATYLWSNGATDSAITGLSAGTYYVTITCINGCTASGSVTITQPTPLTASTSTVNVRCNGGNDGSAQVIPSGGTPGYTVVWSTGSTSLNISGLTAGNYTVTVTDSKGCTAVATAQINQPSAISIAMSKTDVTCFGGTGTATASVSGGTAPYTYVWNSVPAQYTSTVYVPVGSYTVTVSDAYRCTAKANVSLSLLTCQGFVTVTQGGWGAKCSGGNWGCVRNTWFSSAFPAGLTVGSNGRFLLFTTSASIEKFLPSTSTPRALNAGTMVNPTSSQYSNVLAGQTVALTLSVGIDAVYAAFSSSTTPLGSLVISSGQFSGMTVSQLLAEANKVLGGQSSRFSASDITAALDAVNKNYDGGLVNGGYLSCPCVLNNKTDESSNESVLETNTEAATTMTVYPNPATDAANIMFSVKHDASVKIEVFDMNGRLVNALFEGNVVSNQNYKVTLSTVNLQFGIYVARLVSGSDVQTARIAVGR